MDNRKMDKRGVRNVRRLFLLFLIGVLYPQFSFCQNVIKGLILGVDSLAVDAAHVVLLTAADSSIVAATLSDEQGRFGFESVSGGTYIVAASFFGCDPVRKKVMVWGERSESVVNFTIGTSVLLNESKIIFDGIRVKGDTISYSVKHFTTGAERNLRGVLDRLPNVRVDAASNVVTANGKNVSRILIEDKDLFQGNRSIPLNNLPSDGIKEVEVIENYSEFDIFDGFRITDDTVINLKMDDKMKNRWSGTVESSGGVFERYDLRNSLLYVGRKSMFSGIVSMNNIGEQLLKFQDIVQFHGGYGSLLSGGNPVDGVLRLKETYSAFLNNRKDIMRRESILVALNYVASPNKKTSISLNGIYGYENSSSRSQHSYTYLSGLEYDDSLRASGRTHQLLLNAKAHVALTGNLSMMYRGQLLYAKKQLRSENTIAALSLVSAETPLLVEGKNTVLLIRRFGRNSLNLSVEHQWDLSGRDNHFVSDKVYYAPELNLASVYDYSSSERNQSSVAQALFLFRLDDNRFMKFIAQGLWDRRRFGSILLQEMPNEAFDNDANMCYTGGQAEVTLGKDQGRFTFDARLRYLFLQASTNIPGHWDRNRTGAWLPQLRIKYTFAPSHYMSLEYSSDLKYHRITDLLENGYLRKYNQLSFGGLDRLFFRTHSVAWTQVLLLPYTGLSLINMLSLDRTAGGTTDDISMMGYVQLVGKGTIPRGDVFSGTSSIEYRFLSVPLNVRANLNYRYGFMPFFSSGIRYDAKQNNLMASFQLTSHFKSGLNGRLKWSMLYTRLDGLPAKKQMTVQEGSASLFWQKDKFYVEAEVGYRDYVMELQSKDFHFNFEIRKVISNALALKLTGMDVSHLRSKRMTTGEINSLYASLNTVWFMPGSLLIGLSYKY